MICHVQQLRNAGVFAATRSSTRELSKSVKDRPSNQRNGTNCHQHSLVQRRNLPFRFSSVCNRRVEPSDLRELFFHAVFLRSRITESFHCRMYNLREPVELDSTHDGKKPFLPIEQLCGKASSRLTNKRISPKVNHDQNERKIEKKGGNVHAHQNHSIVRQHDEA